MPLRLFQLLPQLVLRLMTLGQLQESAQLLLGLLQLLPRLSLGLKLGLRLLQLLAQVSQLRFQLGTALTNLCRLLLGSLPVFGFLGQCLS